MLDVHVSDGTLMIMDADGSEVLRGVGEALVSDGRVLSTLRADDGLRWELTRHGQQVIVRLHLRNARAAPAMRVEQLRPLVAATGYKDLPLDILRIHQTGWQSWSRAHPPAPFEPNLATAAPPIRGPVMPHRRPDSELVPWMTILETDAYPSLLLGFSDAHHQLGTMEITRADGGGHSLTAATELDGVAIDSGAEVVSEPLLIAQGASADLMDQYARSVAEQMHARSPDEVLTGWCSWYQLYTNVTEADVNRNLASLVRHRDQVPLRLVQLDDGYQRAVGDWLELNEKFPGGMPALVRRIRDHGFAPGVWLAPFLLSARSRVFAEHPDWTVRDAYGQPLNAIDNWGCANFALDTTHPDVLRWLEHVVHTVCEVWGYDYLKLDFLYAAAMRGQRYDPRATAVEAYRRGLEVLRQAAGDRFILGCGAPLIPSIGLVDGMRIGSDVAAYWGAEGNADGPSLRNATRATLARLWLHGRWWANDPDCVIVRTSDTDLSRAEVQAWASVVALSGGMLFVGDDVSRLDAVELHTIGRLLPPSGVAAQATGPLCDFFPERLHLRIERPWGNWDVIALANWSETPRTVVFNPREFGLPSGRLHLFDLWSGDYLGRELDARELGELDPHGVRLLTVHPDLGRPQVVGSTGHLLGDAMDLTHEEWDAGRRTLKLLPTNTGPRARRGDLVVYDPDGPLRRVPFAVADARPIHLKFG